MHFRDRGAPPGSVAILIICQKEDNVLFLLYTVYYRISVWHQLYKYGCVQMFIHWQPKTNCPTCPQATLYIQTEVAPMLAVT